MITEPGLTSAISSHSRSARSVLGADVRAGRLGPGLPHGCAYAMIDSRTERRAAS